MAKYILALDQGTSSSRSIIFDRAGVIIASAQKEHRQYYPQPGWVEHDPREIWATQAGTAVEALSSAGIAPGEVAAIGLTNQRETTIVWNRFTGEPVGNAIVWQDRRTAELCAQLKQRGCEPTIRAKSGLRLDPYFSGTKLAWILDHVPGARVAAERGDLAFGTVDSWLIWNLTNGKVHATDASNASRTLLYNIHTGTWDDELLALLAIPRAMLPEVKGSSAIYGIAAAGNYLPEVPIAGVAGDQQAALFGQACFAPGMAKNTYGTGCFLLMQTGERAAVSQNDLLTTVAWEIDGKREYALEGSVFVAGAVFQWLRDGLGVVQSATEIDALAASVPDSGGVYFVPAFTGLGAPHWDAAARGTIVGLTRGTTRAHLARAAVDAVAFQSWEVIAAMERDAGVPLAGLRVDGGASRSDILMQTQADLLQREVVRPACIETTALGAASLAGLAIGFWKNREVLANDWRVDRVYSPRANAEKVQATQRIWARAVERARDWATD